MYLNCYNFFKNKFYKNSFFLKNTQLKMNFGKNFQILIKTVIITVSLHSKNRIIHSINNIQRIISYISISFY